MLATEQYLYIAQRIATKSKQEAAKKAGVKLTDVVLWEADPEFLSEERQALEDYVEAARAHTKALLSKATTRLDEMLDAKDRAGRTDNSARLKAIELLLKTTGMLSERPRKNEKDWRPSLNFDID